MKKLYKVIVLCCLVALVGCEGINAPHLSSNKVITDEAINANNNSVTLCGELNMNISAYKYISFGMMYAETESELKSHEGISVPVKVLYGTQFQVEISGLQSYTNYYYRAWVCINQKQYIWGEIKSFTAAPAPSITGFSVSDVQTNSAKFEVTNNSNSITDWGLVYSSDKTLPTISSANSITCGTLPGTYYVTLYEFKENTTYYARAYARNNNGITYSKTLTFTTKKESSGNGTSGNGSGSNFYNGHEYVDLGLSVKWATCNVGANKPEDYGEYFAWGETSGKSSYTWYSYKWCNGSAYSLTKYCTSSSYGSLDYKTTLDKSDDAASANWGGSWRMPTDDEFTELRNDCTWTLTSVNGVQGFKVASKKNGKYIFLPAAGYVSGSSLLSDGMFGYYWSSSIDRYGMSWYAYHVYMYIYSSSADRSTNSRYYGQSVRPVCP